jgi:hypothetical protein
MRLYATGKALGAPIGAKVLRFVAVGHIELKDGRLVPEMVMLAVGPPMRTRPRRLRSHSHGTEKLSLCAASLRPDSPSEIAQRDQAIKALQKGETPMGNPAYQWASSHHLARKHCRPIHGPDAGAAVHWSIRRNGKNLIFRSDDWEGARDNGKLVVQLPMASALGD